MLFVGLSDIFKRVCDRFANGLRRSKVCPFRCNLELVGLGGGHGVCLYHGFYFRRSCIFIANFL